MDLAHWACDADLVDYARLYTMDNTDTAWRLARDTDANGWAPGPGDSAAGIGHWATAAPLGPRPSGATPGPGDTAGGLSAADFAAANDEELEALLE